MQQNPWDNDPIVGQSSQPAQPTRAPGIIQGPPAAPDPYREDRANRSDFEDLRDYQTDRADTRFDQTTKLADKFGGLSVVQDYPTVARQYAFALDTSPTPSGDQALIVSYAKMLDPGSVVRETEFDTTAAADSALGRAVSRIKRELGMEGGGRLSEEARQKVREEMRTLAQQYDRQYQEQRKAYAAQAEDFGLNPQWVVGPDLSQTFADDINAFWEEQEANPPADGAGNVPAVASGAQGQSYGDDGNGNPLVIVDDNGQLKALVAGSEDGPFRNFEYTTPGAGVDLNPDAVRLLEQIQAGQDLAGEGGVSDVAKSGLSLGLSDEASGVGAAIGQAITGDFNVGANYRAGQQAEQFRIDQGRERLGAAALPVELLGAGGALRSVGAFGQTRQAVQSVRNAGRPVNRANVQNALTNRATVEGAGIGAVAGAAQGDTLQERGTNALIGGVTGGVLGRAGQAVSNRVANRGQATAVPQSRGAQAQQAADAEGIDLIPAVTGGVTTQRLTSGARQGFISDRPIANAVDRMEGQATAARTRAAEAAGRPIDADDAGELVRRGAEVYSQRTSQIGGRLYDRAERAASGQTFPLTNAVQKVDEELANLAKAPGGQDSQLFRELTTLRNQMANGQFEVGGINALRTRLRNEIMQRGLRGSPEDAAYQAVVRAATDDMIGGLRKAGNDRAANALRTATDFWRKRVETIDQVLDPLLGKNAPRSGEQILASVERLAKPDSGNAVNLARLMRAMPKDEADSVRATVISRLGRPTRGAAETDQTGFSFNTFLTNWNNMTPRARAAMFPEQSRQSLERLATISRSVKEAGGSLNTSNTAGAIVSQGAISGGLWFIDPLTALGAGGTQYMAGKLLASPKFARLLAGAPRNASPQARQAFNDRLGNLAQSEPTLAREIAAYQRALVANDNPANRLAAEDEQDIPQ